MNEEITNIGRRIDQRRAAIAAVTRALEGEDPFDLNISFEPTVAFGNRVVFSIEVSDPSLVAGLLASALEEETASLAAEYAAMRAALDKEQ